MANQYEPVLRMLYAQRDRINEAIMAIQRLAGIPTPPITTSPPKPIIESRSSKRGGYKPKNRHEYTNDELERIQAMRRGPNPLGWAEIRDKLGVGTPTGIRNAARRMGLGE